jgi:hypothetical protein
MNPKRFAQIVFMVMVLMLPVFADLPSRNCGGHGANWISLRLLPGQAISLPTRPFAPVAYPGGGFAFLLVEFQIAPHPGRC